MKADDIGTIAKAVGVISGGRCTFWCKLLLVLASVSVLFGAVAIGVGCVVHISVCNLPLCAAFAMCLLSAVVLSAILSDLQKTIMEKQCEAFVKAVERCVGNEEAESENKANKEASEERRVHELLLKFMENQLQKGDVHVHLPE